MGTISLTETLFYKNGKSGVSRVVGYEDDVRRVARYTFTAPTVGASHISLKFHISGVGDGSAVPLRFFIGTDPESHTNAGADSPYAGELTLADDWLSLSGEAEVLLNPGKTYYLWVFPAEDTYGYYLWYRAGHTSTLTTTGAAMSGVSGENGTLGAEHTIRLTRYSDSLKNTVEAKCGTASLVIAENVTSDTVTWVPPIEWAEQNTIGLTVTAEIKCTTYDGSTPIGSTITSVVFFIPESIVPTVSAIVDDVNGHFYKYGSYIQSKSQAEVSASGSGVYGSTIKEYSVSNGTVTKTGDLTVFDLPNTGEVKFTVTATDSRGRTASAEIKISVVAYFAPTVTILAAYRSDADGNQDDDGTYATVVFKANITPLDNKNSATYAVKYRVRGRSFWNTVEVTTQAGNYAPESAAQTVPIQLDSAYELAVSAKDDFAEIESLYRTVQVAFFLLSVNRSKKSVGIGQKATEAGLCAFGMPAKFNAGVNVNGKTLTFAYNESIGGYVLMETEG